MSLAHISIEPGPTRVETLTQKIGGERTGFVASVFLHVDHLNGKVLAIRFSENRRDGSTLDRLLHALGDEATHMLKQVQDGTIVPNSPAHFNGARP